MKLQYKIYLESKDYSKLLLKAEETGFIGRGAVSRFLTYISNNDLVFLDKNVRTILKSLNLK